MSDDQGDQRSARGELILYSTEDGQAQIQLGAEEGTVWLTQAQMAELFQSSPQAITQLLKSIYRDAELSPEATCKESLQVRIEGSRCVQFRRWATTVLSEYLVKGFAMNDERLKDPDRDYFDELLERIRDIRRQLMTLADWDWALDRLLAGNELSFHV